MVWTQRKDFESYLPASIQVFQSKSSITPGIPLNCFYGIFDPNDPQLMYKPVFSKDPNNTMKTPAQFADQEQNKVYLGINGGYYNTVTGQPAYLFIDEQKFYYPNPTKNGNYYPTVGAFGWNNNGYAEMMWTYSWQDSNSSSWTTFGYPVCSPNDRNDEPEPIPNEDYPPFGKNWTDIQYAVGAGPILLKNNQAYDGSMELLSDNLLLNRHPRTAVCQTYQGQIVFFVADGRSQISGGLFINETALILSQLGCDQALNLDGGGSSCLIVGDKVVNNPCDATGPRKVANAILLQDRNLPKSNLVID